MSKNTENQTRQNIKIAVSLRVGRAVLGVSQAEMAEMLGISKITLARVETLESKLKAEHYMNAIRIFRENGIQIDGLLEEEINIKIMPNALEVALQRLEDETKRRIDRKKST